MSQSQETPPLSQSETGPDRAPLGLWDTVSMIVGIVVGASIFKVSHIVFGNVSGPWQGMGLWLLGGLISLLGALCYAELAATYPRSGGDYVYLTRAFGKFAGFLFGWARLAGILTGSIGAMAYVFADYARKFTGTDEGTLIIYALGSVWCLTVLNLFGVMFGKTTQNVLTIAKVLGLTGIVVVGFLYGENIAPAEIASNHNMSISFALIMVLYAFGGWNDSAYVASEVRNPQRNIPRALILGIGSITVLYLLVNAGYLYGLGFENVRQSETPASDVLELMPGNWGSKAMDLLVMVSVLGALNGMLFTGARVHASMGADHRLFALLGRWNRQSGTPVWALVTEASMSTLLMVAIGTELGRGTIDGILSAVGVAPIAWKTFSGGFETLVSATAPIFWLFFLLTGISLFVLRVKDRGTPRAFSVPLFPIVPILFCITAAAMLYASIAYAWTLSLLALVPLALGVPAYYLSRRMNV